MSESTFAVPSRLSADLGAILALWQRDIKHLVRERSRWLGVVIQPLLIWALLGLGMGSVFKVEGLDGLNYLTFFFPGVIVMVMLFTTVFATMAVIEDRTQGFLQQMAVAPASRAAMVLGKVAGVTTVAMVQAALCVAVSPLAGFELGTIAWPYLLVALVLGSIGLNACVADGTATCDNLATMVQFSVAPGYRFIPQVGLYLDAGLGTLTVEEGDEFPGDTDLATIVWLMPTIRGIYPMEPVDIHAGLGFGYSRRNISGTITNPFNGNTTDVSTTRRSYRSTKWMM